jgi:hypothetical protein
MCLDGRLADDELRRDLRVRQALGDELKHLELPRGQFRDLRRHRLHRRRRPAHELLDHPPRHRRRQQRVALRHCADACDELLGRDVLEEEAARAGPQRVVDVLVHVERREHHDLRVQPVRQHAPRSLDPVHLRHADVHQDHVRLQPLRLRHGIGPVRGLSGDVDVLLGVEDHAEAGADERLVVHDEDAEAHELTGSLARRR